MKWLIHTILRPKWVVFQTEDGLEFGVSIFGIIVSCYKGEPIYFSKNECFSIRYPEKRELGESLMVPPRHGIDYEWDSFRTQSRIEQI